MKEHATIIRDELVQRYNSGEPVSSIVSDTHIPRSTLYSWIKARASSSDVPHESEKQRIARLTSRVVALEERICILQSVECTCSSPLCEKLKCLEELSGQYSVHALCDALKVSRGTYYNHMRRNKRDNTYFAKRREELRGKIQRIYDDNRQVFGADKIAAILRQNGEHVSKEMVRGLMQDMGLISIRQDAKRTYDKESRRYNNHLKQNFRAKQPNQIWVSDITYFRYHDKHFYICVVIDLFSRMIVAHKTGLRNSTQLVKSTIKKAVEAKRPAKGLVLHSDRGSNYCSKAFEDYLKLVGIEHSYSQTGAPYDNAVAESFFSNMKREELYRTNYHSERELRQGIDEYIAFYNEKRPHAKMNFKTPAQVERDYAEGHGNVRE